MQDAPGCAGTIGMENWETLSFDARVIVLGLGTLAELDAALRMNAVTVKLISGTQDDNHSFLIHAKEIKSSVKNGEDRP